jgi:parallel beta-helix repeat protein
MNRKTIFILFIISFFSLLLISLPSAAEESSEFINVRAFGAIGDGTTNDTVAIQAAIDALGQEGTISFPSGTYIISDKLDFIGKKNITVEGNQSTLIQTTSMLRAVWVDNSENILIQNIRIERSEYSDFTGKPSNSKGIYITNSSNIKILHSTFIGFGYSGISWKLSDYIHIEGNHIVGPGSSITSEGNYCYGVNSHETPASYGHVKILNNTISGVAIGIFVGEQNDVVITGNEITDIPGQHGMYLATSNAVISNNTLNNIELDGIKVQIGSKATKDIQNVIISSNAIKNTGNAGIELNQYETSSHYFTNAQVSNNSIYQSSYGIVAKGQKNMKISNNTLYDLDSYGIFASNSYGDINNNIIHNTHWTGIYLRALNEGTSHVHSNTLINPALDTQDDTYKMVGIYITEGLKVFVNHNIIFFDGSFTADMSHSLYTTASTRLSLTGNDFPKDFPVYIGGDVDRIQDNLFGATTLAQNITLISGKGPTRDYYGPTTEFSTARVFFHGDRIWNSAPQPGTPIGWVWACVDSLTACSWKSFGTISED